MKLEDKNMDRLELVKRNTAEIIGDLDKVMKKKKPVVYLGIAITGSPHVGYFVPVLKLADFLQAKFKVILLLADMHGALDNTPWKILDKRFKYYSTVIPLMFKSIGVSIDNFEIVKGSSFQLKKEYMLDVLKMSTYCTINDCKRASAEVVKYGDNPQLSGLIYPIMQSVDEEYLGVDIQYGGLDQRKILMFARENLPKLGYEPRVEIMTPIIPGLIGKKMSASDPKTKIDLLDDEKTVEKKVRGAECTAGVVKDSGLLAFLEFVIMTFKKDKKQKFIVERPEKFGGNLEYSSYAEVEKDFENKKLHPLDLKIAIAREINGLLRPMRKNKAELLKLYRNAYG